MRAPAPDERPVALTIAGSDSGGGAGVQADLRAMTAHGAFGTSVLTATTAQNTRGVADTHVLPVDHVEAQLDAVVEDFDVGAAKTGMLATTDTVDLVARRAAALDVPVVVDPVMVAASGDRLLDPAAESAYGDLVAAADLVTPNVAEAETLTGVSPEAEAGMGRAGEALLDRGAGAALVTGGHLDGEEAVDLLVTPGGTRRFARPRVDTDATHGSGCALSAAIAARLAAGDPLPDAVETATASLARAVRYHLDVGEGAGPVHHAVPLRERAAREPTAEAVRDVVSAFVERDVSPLVPEVGMNVVGATPYAESVAETAAVEGRITHTLDGVAPNRGVRPGASSHVARFLLAAREFDPRLRFAVNCRFGDDVAAALSALDGPVAAYDRGEEPDDVKAAEGSTMGWGARRAFEATDATPVAVTDRGAVGKEAIAKLLAPDAATLRERAFAVLDRLR